MHSRLLAGLTLISLTFSVPVTGMALPTQMAPAGPWKVDYGYTECTAQRDYTDSEGTATLSIRPLAVGDIVEFVIGRDGRGPNRVQQSKAVVTAGTKTERSMMLRYGLSKPGWRKFDIYPVPIGFLDGLRSDVVLSFAPTQSTHYDFPALAMGKVVDALKTCVADLRKFWNIDGDKDQFFSTLSRTEVRTIFRSEDYPLAGHERGQESSGQFLLMVDEKGKIVGCTPIKSSGLPVFNVLSCGVIKERAVASPALDKKGKPVRSTIVTPEITFRMGY